MSDPEIPRNGAFRVVVTSIGTAGGALMERLSRALPLTAEGLAARVLRAPSELLGDLNRETAEAIAALLRQAGLETSILAREETFQAGDGDLEVALAPTDLTRLPEVVAEIVRFLGCDRARAEKVLGAAPAILISGVSAATVVALRRRFEPLGVELVVSRPQEASYDVYLRAADGDALRRLRRLLGSRCASAAGDLRSPVASGIYYGEARALWRDAERYRVPLRILNRDFLPHASGIADAATLGGTSR
jgi:hypothetical protein